jgi:CBS domain containing-hemolysin-like protein
VFDAIEFEDPEEDENDDDNVLLGQWCYEHFGAIPKSGQSFDYYNLKVTVENIEHNRIMKVNLEVKK